MYPLVCRLRPIFPGRLQPSIFGTAKLNFRVRNGNGWTLCVKNTDFSWTYVHWKPNKVNLTGRRNSSNCVNLNQSSSSPRSISIGQLNTLLCLHLRPIKLVVCKWPYQLEVGGISNLEVGFTLRCLQRLSNPYAATQLCTWQYNWCTGGTSDPVLSY